MTQNIWSIKFGSHLVFRPSVFSTQKRGLQSHALWYVGMARCYTQRRGRRGSPLALDAFQSNTCCHTCVSMGSSDAGVHGFLLNADPSRRTHCRYVRRTSACAEDGGGLRAIAVETFLANLLLLERCGWSLCPSWFQERRLSHTP